jgi:hypothetical protein
MDDLVCKLKNGLPVSSGSQQKPKANFRDAGIILPP